MTKPPNHDEDFDPAEAELRALGATWELSFGSLARTLFDGTEDLMLGDRALTIARVLIKIAAASQRRALHQQERELAARLVDASLPKGVTLESQRRYDLILIVHVGARLELRETAYPDDVADNLARLAYKLYELQLVYEVADPVRRWLQVHHGELAARLTDTQLRDAIAACAGRSFRGGKWAALVDLVKQAGLGVTTADALRELWKSRNQGGFKQSTTRRPVYSTIEEERARFWSERRDRAFEEGFQRGSRGAFNTDNLREEPPVDDALRVEIAAQMEAHRATDQDPKSPEE